MKRDKIVLVILVVIVVGVIVLINFIKSNGNYGDDEIQCIADNSMLIVLKTCSHCAQQKIILGDDINKFEIIDASENPGIVNQYFTDGIIKVPAWIINSKVFTGVHTMSELKELTGC